MEELLDLPPSLKPQIDALLEQARLHEELGEGPSACALYLQVLEHLPAGQAGLYQETTLALTALGDMAFKQGDFEGAWVHLQQARQTQAGAHNAFVLLRLGQVAHERQDMLAATEYLCRALMMHGPDIFEEDDPKYLQHVRDFMQSPDRGW